MKRNGNGRGYVSTDQNGQFCVQENQLVAFEMPLVIQDSQAGRAARDKAIELSIQDLKEDAKAGGFDFLGSQHVTRRPNAQLVANPNIEGAVRVFFAKPGTYEKVKGEEV